MAAAKNPQTYLALLRGINVAGKNILPMKALAEIVRQAGGEQVSTFIQSGNALFAAPANAESALAEKISAAIEAQFGYRIPVVLRTREELAAAIAANPYSGQGIDEKFLHVYFLQSFPAKEAVAALDPNRSVPDTFAVCGREVYLNLPNGMARTKLTNAWLDSKLKTVSTARNWNTTLKLLELMQAQFPSDAVKC
jgi:uncharacterized protein (DUF1697 family)